jgi:ABC-type Mn2+/Zn2+ transport system ATPase subunit
MPAPIETPAIEAAHLTVRFEDREALSDLTFAVRAGEAVAIIGPNGAGKTTLLKALLGIVPYEGEVRIWGRDRRELRGAEGRIAYVPQRFDLDRSFPLTVLEFLLLGTGEEREWWGLRRGARRGEILQGLERVGAAHLLDRRLGALSGGEFQRVLIAYALARGPDILLLDEPLAGVDLVGESALAEHLHYLHEELGLTLLLVSHDLHMVYRDADQVLCLNRHLCCQGPPDEVLTSENLRRAYGEAISTYHHHSH